MNDGAPFHTPTPLIARLTARAGPPVARLIGRAGTGVMAVPGRYCVTYVIVGPGAIAVIDCGSSADIPMILSAIEWLGRPVSQVRCVIPTHLHFDHMMGIDPLARRIAAPVALGAVAHEHVTAGRALRFPPALPLVRAIGTWVMQGLPLPPIEDWLNGLDYGFPWARDAFLAGMAPPLLHGSELRDLPGWTAWHTPGHADDAICLHHAGAGFLVAGDTVRNFYGGEWNPLLSDAGAYAATRRFLRSLHVETVFPGHGPIIEGGEVMARLRRLPPWLP